MWVAQEIKIENFLQVHSVVENEVPGKLMTKIVYIFTVDIAINIFRQIKDDKAEAELDSWNARNPRRKSFEKQACSQMRW